MEEFVVIEIPFHVCITLVQFSDLYLFTNMKSNKVHVQQRMQVFINCNYEKVTDHGLSTLEKYYPSIFYNTVSTRGGKNKEMAQ